MKQPCGPFALAQPAILLLAGSALSQESRAIFDAPLVIAHEEQRIERLLDLDGDGDLDAIGWWPTSNSNSQINVQGWLNDGSGQLTLGFEEWTDVDYVSINYFNETVTAQLDGDGRDDFVIGLKREVLVFRSNGDAEPTHTWTLSLPGPEPLESVATADLNGDEQDDLVVATDHLRVYLNDGAGDSFTEVSSALVGTPATELVLVEATGDPRQDVVLLQPGVLRIFPLVGGSLGSPTDLPHDLVDDLHLTAGDVDGDGDNDLVLFGDDSYQVFRRTAPTTFTPEALRTGGPATDLYDIDQDGDLDGLCCGGSGGDTPENRTISFFEVAWNDGTGQFGPAQSMEGLGARHLAGAGDLDADGDIDLVAGRCVYYARGPLHELPGHASPAEAPHAMEIMDVNEDGHVDLRVGIPDYMANLGNGMFIPAVLQVAAAPAGTRFIGPGFTGDFDEDGDLDFVVRHEDEQTQALISMRVLWNSGGGAFADGGAAGAPGIDFNIDSMSPYSPGRALTSDIDGDGDLDLITLQNEPVETCNSCFESSARIWWNDGSAFFDVGPLVSDIAVQGAHDFDGDGDVDLIGQHEYNGIIYLVRANGDGTFAPPEITNSFWRTRPDQPIVLRDFDHDGVLDLAFLSSIANDVTLLSTSDGFATYTLQLLLFPIELAWYETDHRLTVADVDGDGWDDIIASRGLYADDTSFVLLKESGGSGWHDPIQQVFLHRAALDIDGDGDPDLIDDQKWWENTLLETDVSTFCVAGENSVGAACLISAGGTTSVADNTFTLVAVSAPPGVFGKFYYGPGQAQIPFGDGFRCVQGGSTGTFRLYPVTPASAQGTASRLLDFSAPPAGGAGPGVVLPGSTWNFQYWYRDPQGPLGNGFNLSSGLTATFEP